MIPKPRQLSSGNWFIQLRLSGVSIPVIAGTENECTTIAGLYKSGALQPPGPGKRTIKGRTSSKTVGKMIDNYISNREGVASPTTIKAYKSYRKYHFQSIMDTPAHKLTSDIVRNAIKDEVTNPNPPAPKTLKNAYNLVKSAVDGMCSVEWDKIALPQPNAEEGRALEEWELKKLFNELSGKNCEIPALLAAWLSLRRSEIFGLTWDCIDFDKKTVTVKRAAVIGEGGKKIIKTTKTKSSARVISCPDYILDKLASIKGEAKKEDLIFQFNPNFVYNALARACDRAGIKRIGIHGLRHTNASVMLALNVPDKYAMARGGWSTDYVMKRVYQHKMDEKKRQVDEDINQYFERIIANKNANKKSN